MNYQISEDEYNRLGLLRDQLELVAGLLTIADVELGHITSTNLYAFMAERQRELDDVLHASSKRSSLQWENEKAQGVMQYFDWLHALRIANGDALHTPHDAEVRITDKLTRAAAVDADMGQVLKAWHAVLGRVSNNTPLPRKSRKRKQLATNA